jgi:hypothetical protein
MLIRPSTLLVFGSIKYACVQIAQGRTEIVWCLRSGCQRPPCAFVPASRYATGVSGGFRQADNNVALPRALLSVGTLIRGAGPAECSPRLLGPLAGRSLNAGGLDIAARCRAPSAHALQAWGLLFYGRRCLLFRARDRLLPNPSGRCSANPSCMLRASVYRWFERHQLAPA